MAEDQQGSNGARVGSVAEEAARLLDALGGWAQRSGYAEPGASATPDDAAASDDAAAGVRAEVPADHHCAACGAQTGVGRAVSCRVCPLCQGITLLRSVRPETVDRLADLASAVAGILRDVAGEQRHEARRDEDHPPPASRSASGGVQEIRIDDEDTEGVQP